MQPLVQSAIDAANHGENNKALEFLKQALAANPNDVDAWLVVAAVVDQPERKRQCLNRVLSLDSTNQIARDELLEMDRAAMGGPPPSAPQRVADPRLEVPVSQSISRPAAPPSNYPASTSAFEQTPSPMSTSAFEVAPAPTQSAPVQAKVASQPASKARLEKPLVFKYPILWRILTYLFTFLFLCLALIVASQDVMTSLPVFGLVLVMLISVAVISPKVEVTETWIRASGMLSSSEVNWSDIKSMKSSAIGRKLELFKSNGQVVKVSTQVSGYPRIIEMLRQKRPDLFGMAASPSAQGMTSRYEQASTSRAGDLAIAATFSGTKKFEKSFLRQYLLTFLLIPVCLVAIWAAFAEPENRIGALVLAAFCGVLMILQLFQVNALNVEPNKLTFQTLFGEKEFSGREIKEIKMQTVRTRSGTATHYVKVIPVQGSAYSLAGFAEGAEIIYGFLTNWWNTYRNR